MGKEIIFAAQNGQPSNPTYHVTTKKELLKLLKAGETLTINLEIQCEEQLIKHSLLLDHSVTAHNYLDEKGWTSASFSPILD